MSALVRSLPLDDLDRRADARAIDEDKVAAIATSMGDVGQINPIRVRPLANGRYEIVAGVHRVEACRWLGLVEVDALIVESGDLFAELAMIDENLCRADLGPADRARQTARRKQIYEELHPETQHGGDRTERPSRQVGDLPRAEPPRFTADTAAKTGASERTVQRDAERGERVSPDVLELIRGTELDTGAFLDKLKGFPPDQQRMLAERELEARKRINGHRALMSDRREPDDSLDYFPTPPWATRALIEDVLRPVGLGDLTGALVWEPACGEGHISGVLEEYGARVAATDIFDYSADGRSPPGWRGATDFLDPEQGGSPDWIITNPPFGDNSLAFALKALQLAKRGVALFVRQQWLEGIERYSELFSKTAPTYYAQFAERVNLCKGRWEPDGTTATAYCWLVWLAGRGEAQRPWVMWIPPGRRVERSRPDDVERFTAHPVISVSGGPASPHPDADEAPTLASPATDSEPACGAGEEADGAGRPVTTVAPSAETPGGAPLPVAGEGGAAPSAPPSSEEINEIIRKGYAPPGPVDFPSLEAATGLTANAIRIRAHRMELGDRDRQRDAVAAANRKRAKGAVDA